MPDSAGNGSRTSPSTVRGVAQRFREHQAHQGTLKVIAPIRSEAVEGALKYLAGYPPHLLPRVQTLIDQRRLGDELNARSGVA